jgi:mevalonate pyrophosphate decarboxylase
MITYRAFPTIPIVFVSSAHPDRKPLHNSMGLAVTDLEEKTYVETEVEFSEKTEFILNGKELPKERMRDVLKVVEHFKKLSGRDENVFIRSNNHNIYSGSSDAGAAALVFALNDLYETNLTIDELAEISMNISESSIRSVYGGLNEINVDGYPHIYGKLIATPEELKEIRIFAVAFDYKTRVSAAEIFQVTRANPFYEMRLKMVPTWIARIKWGLLKKDWDMVFKAAEENCHNAHQLLEYMDVYARRKEMINVCYDVVQMRKEGLKAYWTAGGGNVINVFSWGETSDEVLRRLKENYPVKEYKVAGGPKRVA